MSDHQRKSFATPNYSHEANYPSPEEKPKPVQEKSKSKPTLFLTGVDMARRF